MVTSERPFNASARAAIETAAGKNHSRLPSTAGVSARNFSANARASAGPWFIFQLAANVSCRAVMILHRVQRGHARKLLALEKLERRAATGRDMGDLVSEPGLSHSRGGITSANDRHRAVRCRLGHGARYGESAVVERWSFEHAHWPVPHYRPGLLDAHAEALLSAGIDVVDSPPCGDGVAAHHPRLGAGGQLAGNDATLRQHQLASGFLHQVAGQIEPVGLY